MRHSAVAASEPAQPSYEVVARLSPDEQRQLLHAGSAVERLGAAWALGLRAGATALPELRTAVAAAPVPGLRAHLAIVLAGLGERHLVETLALHDPDELVRATAGEHLLRTAPSSEDLTHQPAVAQLLRDPSADVRVVVLRELLRLVGERRLSALSIDDLERLAHDPDQGCRWLALEALAELPADATLVRIFEWRLTVEPNPELCRWLAARIIAAGEARTILRLLWRDGSERDEDLLSALEDRGQRFTWDEIAALTELGQPALDAHLMALLTPEDSLALTWLLTCAVRAEQWPPPRTRLEWDAYGQALTTGRAAEVRLDEMLSRLRPEQLTARDRELCRLLMGFTVRRLLELEDEFCDELGELIDSDARSELEELRESDWYKQQIQRLNDLRRLVSDSNQ
jgi:hypothetical protein